MKTRNQNYRITNLEEYAEFTWMNLLILHINM